MLNFIAIDLQDIQDYYMSLIFWNKLYRRTIQLSGEITVS